MARPGAYLRTTVVNGCRAVLRRREVEERHGADAATPAVDELPTRLVELRDALERLTERQRVEAWRWYVSPELAGIEISTVAPAGSHVMVLSAERLPVSVDVDSGATVVHRDGPLAGLGGASTAWTGRELVIWGGEGAAVGDHGPAADGAVWTPAR